MKIKKIFFCFLVLVSIQLKAQDAIVSSGGNANASNGNVSYTVGQVVYTTHFATSGSMAQGVQQPYEIQTLLGLDNFNINLELSVYPNPTTNILSLEVRNYDFENLQYQLFDINGRMLLKGAINASVTSFELEVFPSAVYLLKVSKDNKELKTFKILKK
jgi:hypothetical protein